MNKSIPMEDWLRGCIYHDGRHGYVTLPIDKVHQIANYIQRTRRSTTDGLIDLEVIEADRKTEPMKTTDYCDICKRDMCEDCIADATNPYCVPSHYEINYEPKDEPKTQIETQNSNLTFEKDECAKEYEELGLKELKALIEADRKDEPTCDTCRHKGVEGCEQPCLGCGCCGLYEAMTGNDKLKEKVVEFIKSCARCKHRPIGAMMCEESCHYEPKDEPQTETEIAKAIVHKMIDDSVIAEDAYPDLRQKMHDAVDEYKSQTDCDGCRHYADKHTADACYECKRSYTDGYVPQTEREDK